MVFESLHMGFSRNPQFTKRFGESRGIMLMCGKEARNQKQELDSQHHTIPNQRKQRLEDKHYGNMHNAYTTESLSFFISFTE